MNLERAPAFTCQAPSAPVQYLVSTSPEQHTAIFLRLPCYATFFSFTAVFVLLRVLSVVTVYLLLRPGDFKN